MINCKYCGIQFPKKSAGGHTTWCHKNPKRIANLERLGSSRQIANNMMSDSKKLVNKKCKWCQQIVILTLPEYVNHVRWCEFNPSREVLSNTSHTSYMRSFISEESVRKRGESIRVAHQRGDFLEAHARKRGKPGPLHTEETKSHLSLQRKEWLASNPDLHPWKRPGKFTSEPCEYLKALLKERGHMFVAEHQPLRDRFFSVDIAFVDKKVAIEVNGEQHYNRDKSLKTYYKERHDLIEAAGWIVVEMHYKECYNPASICVIEKLLM